MERWGLVVMLLLGSCGGGVPGDGAAVEPLYSSARFDLRTRHVVDLWHAGEGLAPEGEVVRVGIRIDNRSRLRVVLHPLRLEVIAGGKHVAAPLLDSVGSFTPYLARQLTLSFLLPAGVRAADVERACLTWGLRHGRRELVSEVAPFIRQGERLRYAPEAGSCDATPRAGFRLYDYAYYRAD